MRAEGAAPGAGSRREGRLPGELDAAPFALEFFARPAPEVARDLLGRLLVSRCGDALTAGAIVETEAYTGRDDPASHAAERIGRTERNDPLFGPPGTVYMHLNYGIHWCLNAVTDAEGTPAGVLIRALEPVHGEAVMRERRGRDELTSGPARLVEALGLGPRIQRHRLDRAPVWIAPGEPVSGEHVVRTGRIGISRAADRELRYCDGRSRWVSRRAP